MMTWSLACHDVSRYGPAPAVWVFSQALPRSLLVWLASTVFMSTTLPTFADRQYSTKLVASASVGSFISSV